MKKCNKCLILKKDDCFHLTKNHGKAALYSHCKECVKLKYLKNKEKIAQKAMENRNVKSEYDKKYYEANKLKRREQNRIWGKQNSKKKIAHNAKRKKAIKKATPSWITSAHFLEIERFYTTCPKGYQVDHIIPLQGKEVCGLHVPWNLQHLTAFENNSKHNRLV